MNKILSKKVFVGVSGGVDSSVALALLKEKGYDVTGVFLKVWHPEWLICDWREERRSAMRVCATLGVPFITIDCEQEYKKEVADYMINEYKAGRVPNPDIFCNKYIKFGVFLKKAEKMGADFVATGHYAQIREVQITNDKLQNRNTKYELQESSDKNKDQSYFLYTLNQEQLSHVFFPVGDLSKPQVRELARKFDLPTAEKKDSQGLCFIGKVDMKDFLSHYIEIKEGDVLNTKGEVVGRHQGSVFYTIGERHGFNITKKTAEDPRFFVVEKDFDKNTITVADKIREGNKYLSTKEIFIKDMHFISGDEPVETKDITVRIRYRQEKQKVTLERQSNGYGLHFESPQGGVAIGQSAVLYQGEVCLGGGIIEKTDTK